MSLLDPNELEQLIPAETNAFPSPIPTQFVSSDEFLPSPQTENQKRLEARIKALGSELAKHQGLTRNRQDCGSAFDVSCGRAGKDEPEVRLRREAYGLTQAR